MTGGFGAKVVDVKEALPHPQPERLARLEELPHVLDLGGWGVFLIDEEGNGRRRGVDGDGDRAKGRRLTESEGRGVDGAGDRAKGRCLTESEGRGVDGDGCRVGRLAGRLPRLLRGHARACESILGIWGHARACEGM